MMKKQRSISSLVLLGAVSWVTAQESEQPSPLYPPLQAEQTTEGSASSDESEQIVEEVIVHGIRTALENDIKIKRESNSFVDAITSEDIAKFPDKNVADSLQRVPGVTMIRDGGEGSQVSVRGFGPGLTLTQLNGNFVASTPGEPNRQFDYNLLPSSLVQRVEVIKSPEARYDEGGVGGTVRVYSRRPFDLDPHTALVSLEGTYADVTEDVDPHYSLLYSWKDDDERYGVLVAYTNQERRNRSLNGSASSWRWWRDDPNGDEDPEPTPAVDVNGNPIAQQENVLTFGGTTLADGTPVNQGFWAPQLIDVGVLDETREREGIQASFQARPMENLTLGVNYFRFNLGLDSTSNFLSIPEWALGFNSAQGFVESLNFLGDPNEPGAILTEANFSEDADGTISNIILPWIRGSYNEEENTSDTWDLSLAWEGEGISVNALYGRTKAEGGPRENFDFAYYTTNWDEQREGFIENGSRFTRWSIDNEVDIVVDLELQSNLLAGFGGNPDPGSTSSSFFVSTQEETFSQVDLELDVDVGPITTLRAGVKYRDAEVDRATANTFFIVRDPNRAEGTVTNDNVASFNYTNNDGIPLLTSVLQTEPLDNLIGGFSINQFPAVDVDEFRDQVTQNFDRFTRFEDNFVFNVGEETWAYYLQADYEWETVRGNFGVRVVDVEQTISSSDTFVTRLDHTDDETGDFVENVRDVGFSEFFNVETSTRSNTEVLPSFNLAWEPVDDWIVRAAAAKVLSRPEFTQLGIPQRLTLITQEYFDDRQAFGAELGWSGGGGNADLEPMTAWQFDVGVEWYFSEGSVLGAAVFNKEIDNFIIEATISTERPVEGVSVPVSPFTSWANASEASLTGVELFGSYVFDFGFGVSSNVTYLDADQADISLEGQFLGRSELPGTSEEAFNLTAFYEQEAFSVRVAYNYRSEQVLSLQSGLRAFLDEYDQVDVNATYNLTENLNTTLAIVNLTKSEQYSYLGNDTRSRLLGNEYSGRRAYLGLNYRF